MDREMDNDDGGDRGDSKPPKDVALRVYRLFKGGIRELEQNGFRPSARTGLWYPKVLPNAFKSDENSPAIDLDSP